MSVALPNSSAIPGALAQTLAIARAAFPANTTVWFGADLPSYSAPLTFQVSEITGDQQPAEIGQLYRREETFNLVCTLVTYQGGQPEFETQLPTLMESFALLSAAIGNNPSLNGSVRYAQVGNFVVTAQVDANGMSVLSLDFNIRCTQRVNSLSS